MLLSSSSSSSKWLSSAWVGEVVTLPMRKREGRGQGGGGGQDGVGWADWIRMLLFTGLQDKVIPYDSSYDKRSPKSQMSSNEQRKSYC